MQEIRIEDLEAGNSVWLLEGPYANQWRTVEDVTVLGKNVHFSLKDGPTLTRDALTRAWVKPTE